MAESSESAKAAKKTAKAQAKLEKKLVKAVSTRQAAVQSDLARADDAGRAAAERSAAAAERQVILQRYRVWLSLVLAAIAVATFMFTVKPWELFTGANSAPAQPREDTEARD